MEAGLVEHVRLDKRLYLDADKKRLVEEGDPDAAFFYGGVGTLKPKSEVEKYGGSVENVVTGDEARDVVHVEVETPNVLPGPRVEGSGKATIPVTQADRAAAGDARRRAAVSGRDRRKTEGEEFLEGNLKPLPDQVVVGETRAMKQTAQMEPAHYAEGEKEAVKGSDEPQTAQKTEPQPQTQQTQEQQQAGKQQARPAGNKMADRPADK